MNRIPLMLISAAVLAIAMSQFYPASAQPSGFVTAVLDESGHHRMILTQGFDKEGCEADCRAMYGGDLYFRGFRRGYPGYYAYAQCIQNCNTRFWKEFDRRSRELEQE